MADVTIDTAVSASFHNEAGERIHVWIDQDIGYVFYLEVTSFDLVYRKSSDSGATWGAEVEIETNFTDNYAIWYDNWTPGDTGGLIQIWWQEDSTDDIRWNSLDTSDDSLGTEQVVFDGASAEFAARTTHYLSGTKAVGGNLYVQFWLDTSGERGFYRSTDGGANWTSRTDGADGDAVDLVSLLPDADAADTNDVAMVYWDRSADELSIKKYDNSGNSWGETSISAGFGDDAVFGTGWLNFSAVNRHSDGHIIVVAWTEVDTATADLKCFDITLTTPTIDTKTDVITDSDDCAQAALFIDQTNDDLYVVYMGADDGSQTLDSAVDCHYSKSDDGGDTWGGETTYSVDTADDLKVLSAGVMTPGNADGLFCPVFHNSDLSDLFVNVTNQVKITAAVAAASFPPRHPIRHTTRGALLNR